MERWREGFHQKGKIYQQDIISWCIQGTLKLLDVIVLKSHNTIEFGCLFPGCCTGSS